MRLPRRFFFAATAAALLPWASGPALAATPAETSPEKSQETSEASGKADLALPPALVAPDQLRALLPEPPPGWKAERPEMQKSDTEAIHLSSARRSYYRPSDEDDAPVGAVTIIDSANNADFFDTDEEEKWEAESETAEGYDKRLFMDGMRVIEHYNKEARTASLSVFVGNRYFVQIELTNESPKELYTWLKRIDLARLATLK